MPSQPHRMWLSLHMAPVPFLCRRMMGSSLLM
uniref:Uncharacterized protein n=1 Tax=Arundo donax TaxID=35708 RepID=A0A0A8YTW3_ARUDO